MASRTQHYGLATGLVADDFIEAGHHNDLANVVDRVLGGVLTHIGPQGVHTGWELLGGAAISPGRGLLGACWCETAVPQVVSGLASGATNYVYAIPVSESPTSGAVAFVAQLAPPGPLHAALLGMVTTDASGQIVEVVGNPSGAQRSCHGLRFGTLSGVEVVRAVPGGAAAQVVVDHREQGVFRIPGDLQIDACGAGFRWSVSAHHAGDGFALMVWNDGAGPADFSCAWTREGLLR
jgi:hypothetical protein